MKRIIAFFVLFSTLLHANPSEEIDQFIAKHPWYREVVQIYIKGCYGKPTPSVGMQHLVVEYSRVSDKDRKAHCLLLLKKGVSAAVDMTEAVNAAFKKYYMPDLAMLSFLLESKLVKHDEPCVKEAFKSRLSIYRYEKKYEQIQKIIEAIKTWLPEADAREIIVDCVTHHISETSMFGLGLGPLPLLRQLKDWYPDDFEAIAQDILQKNPADFSLSFTDVWQGAEKAQQIVALFEGTSLALSQFVTIALDKDNPHRPDVFKVMLRLQPALFETALMSLCAELKPALLEGTLSIFDLREWLKGEKGKCYSEALDAALSYLEVCFAEHDQSSDKLIDTFKSFLLWAELSENVSERLYKMCEAHENCHALQLLWHRLIENYNVDIACQQLAVFFDVKKRTEAGASYFGECLDRALSAAIGSASSALQKRARAFVRAARFEIKTNMHWEKEDNTFMRYIQPEVARQVLLPEIKDCNQGLSIRAEAFCALFDGKRLLRKNVKAFLDKETDLFSQYVRLAGRAVDEELPSVERYRAAHQLTVLVDAHAELILPKRVKKLSPEFLLNSDEGFLRLGFDHDKIVLSEDGKRFYVLNFKNHVNPRQIITGATLILWAFDAVDGKVLWKAPLLTAEFHERQLATLLVQGDEVIVTDGTTLWILDAKTGEEKKDKTLSSKLEILKMKKLEDGRLVVVIGHYNFIAGIRFAQRLQIFDSCGELIQECEVEQFNRGTEQFEITEKHLIRSRIGDRIWVHDLKDIAKPVELSIENVCFFGYSCYFVARGRLLYYLRMNPCERYEIVCYDMLKNKEKWFIDAHCDGLIHQLFLSPDGEMLRHMTHESYRMLRLCDVACLDERKDYLHGKSGQTYSSFKGQFYHMDGDEGCFYRVNTKTGEEELILENDDLIHHHFLGYNAVGKAIFVR